jgi:hypothetical protein
MSERFIKLEDEITLRVSLRAVYKHEGMIGIYKVMGELAQSLEIVGQMCTELLEEENHNK